MEEELQLRVHGDESLPTLIYLPGLHGDWTLIGAFRKAVAGKVRFVEMAYPRTLDWSLDDYAAAIESALAKQGIASGWLLGESFGSQPAWTLVARGRFQAQGVILAGGFVKYPLHRMLRLTEKIAGRISTAFFIWLLFGYAQTSRIRFRRSPETLAGLDEFIVRRTELDHRAAQHRLRLIAENDPRAVAHQTRLPVFGLSGAMDPIVPWPLVRRWLKRHCPALRDYKIVLRADHNVLTTAPQQAAQHILASWLS
jgi:pimeloyl-ACP methyl ester carboxylesterase